MEEFNSDDSLLTLNKIKELINSLIEAGTRGHIALEDIYNNEYTDLKLGFRLNNVMRDNLETLSIANEILNEVNLAIDIDGVE